MAKVQRIKAAGLLTAGVLFAAALLMLAGCQHQQIVENLPPPNFAGPNVVQSAPPPVVQRPAPVAPAPQPAQPKEQVAKVPSGIPRDWIPSPRAEKRQWLYIVIHHSASPAGSLAVIDREHKEKGWDGCGYHFVIGNGTNSGDGRVEPSYRWQIQKWGAHAKTPDNQFNEHGIGICLVGNFDIDRPTPAQMQSLNKLVSYLMRTYHVPANRVLGHRETKPTDCPGRNLSIAGVRRSVSQLADGTDATASDEPTDVASTESTPELLMTQPTAGE
jgi:hypothetical protein